MGEQKDWRTHAACRHIDPELFFPEGTAGPALQTANLAKRICGTCPVQARCLTWALDHGTAFGIWGGLGEGERRNLRHAGRRSGLAEAGAAEPGGAGEAGAALTTTGRAGYCQTVRVRQARREGIREEPALKVPSPKGGRARSSSCWRSSTR